MLRTYPSPLRTRALEVVYEDLGRAAGGSGKIAARARLLLLTKGLYDRAYEAGAEDKAGLVLSGVPLVEEMGRIGKEIRRSAKSADSDWLDLAGEWLATLVESEDLDETLRDYLFSTLAALAKPAFNPPVTLLLRHLLLASARTPDNKKRLELARSHASIHPTNASLQMTRLQAELGSDIEAEQLRAAFASIIKAVTQRGLSREDADIVAQIWLLWMSWEEEQRAADRFGMDKLWKKTMRESMRTGSEVPNLHSRMLARYFDFRLKAASPESALPIFRELAATYRPRTDFFISAMKVFYGYALATRNLAGLDEVFQAWRAAAQSPYEVIRATIVYARACLGAGHPKAAAAAVDVIRREMRENPAMLAELETEWASLLDEKEAEQAKSDEQKQQEADEMFDQVRRLVEHEDAAGAASTASKATKADAMDVDVQASATDDLSGVRL